MILNTINGDTNITFFRDLRAAGVKPATTPTLSFSISEQTGRSLGAAAVAGDYSAYTYFQSIDSPENRDFLRRFHEKYPQHSVTDPMETAYVGVKLSAQAVNEAQSTDPKRIRRACSRNTCSAPAARFASIRILSTATVRHELPRFSRTGNSR